MVDIAVVICTRNRPDQLPQAVAAVLQSPYPSFELLVVDQSTDDLSREALRPFEADPRLRYLATPTKGLSVARNIGIGATTAPIIAFTDDDCVPDREWVGRIAACFSEHPSAELLFGAVHAPSSGCPEDGWVPVYLPPEHGGWQDRLSTGMGMGANMSLRRTLVSRIGGFDEVLGAGAPFRSSEDADFGLRATAAGATAVLDPALVVVHAGGVRQGADRWLLWSRDGYATGALMAKMARCGDWMSIAKLVWLVGYTHFDVARAVLTWRRPFGLTRALVFTLAMPRGLLAGLQWPTRGRKARCLFLMPA